MYHTETMDIKIFRIHIQLKIEEPCKCLSSPCAPSCCLSAPMNNINAEPHLSVCGRERIVAKMQDGRHLPCPPDSRPGQELCRMGYKLHYFKRGGGKHFHTMIELSMINDFYTAIHISTIFSQIL